jgi:hypothetical protein
MAVITALLKFKIESRRPKKWFPHCAPTLLATDAIGDHKPVLSIQNKIVL